MYVIISCHLGVQQGSGLKKTRGQNYLEEEKNVVVVVVHVCC